MCLHVPGMYLKHFYLNNCYGMDVVRVWIRWTGAKMSTFYSKFTQNHLSCHKNTFHKEINPFGMCLHVPEVYLGHFYMNNYYGMDVVGVWIRWTDVKTEEKLTFSCQSIVFRLQPRPYHSYYSNKNGVGILQGHEGTCQRDLFPFRKCFCGKTGDFE